MQNTDALGMNMALRAMQLEITSAQPGAPIRPPRAPRSSAKAVALRRATARVLRSAADRVEPRRAPACAA